MTTHLEDTQLVEIAGRAETHPHVAQCPRCRARVDELRALLEAMAANEVPEPSPLFWEHFAARVAQKVKTEPPAAGWAERWWIGRFAWRPAALVAAILLVAAVVVWRTGLVPSEQAKPAGRVAARDSAAPKVSASAEEDDESWALVTDVGAAMDLDMATAAGFDIQPGAAEMAAVQLSADEQRELVRLLQADVAQRE